MCFRIHFSKQLTFEPFCIYSTLPVSMFMGFLCTLFSFPSLAPASRPTQPLIEWVPRALSSGLKRPGRQAGRSRPFSVENRKMVELRLHPIGLYGVMLN
jgi:hypothetical protein